MKAGNRTNSYFTVVTGSSEGIGKALAEYCAKLGMNVVLVSLPGESLTQTEKYLRFKYNVEVYSLGIDLTDEDASRRVGEWIDNNHISVNMLINNAGCGSIGNFDEITYDVMLKQIELNITSLTVLTRLLMDQLKRNQPAYILNVGSIAGFFLVPYKAVYGATKSYVVNFSLSLREELAPYAIGVSLLCPGGVTSNYMAMQRKTRHGWIGRLSYLSPEQVAREAIDGLLKNKRVIMPGSINRILFFLNHILPPKIRIKIAANSLKKELDVDIKEMKKERLGAILSGINR